jgi:superfamily II DNA or RNA helicase
MDIRDLKVEENGEYNYEQVKKKYTQTLYGLVVKSMRDFNPELKPTLLFAPGVAESAEFARVFTENGIKSAHIDGEDVWCDGKFYSSDANARSEVMDRFRDGDIRIICNRYVLREGIDIPYAAHMILATPIGSVRSYIQIVGRILRRSPETPDYVTIVDHGGSFWSHGSPNEDRDWSEIYDLPERTCSILRKERIRERVEREPDACPECGLVFIPTTSHRCPQCGHEMKKKFRTVLQTNSELVRVTGDAIRPRFVKQKPDTQKIWTKLYHGCANSKKKRGVSFIQAEALFLREHGYYPPRTLNFMPTRDIDWLRQIRDVPMGRLRRDDR